MFGKSKKKIRSALKISVRNVNFDYLKSLKKDLYWHNDNPVSSHFFNALQAMFPEGERFFMDAAIDVRNQFGKQNLSDELLEQIQLFVRQEACHGKQHDQWTQALVDLGYTELAEYDELLRNLNLEAKKRFSPLFRLSLTAASEHFTASLARLFVYHRPDFIEQARSPFKELFLYHALEEVEHKAVCFDLYQAAGGGYLMRAYGMLFAMLQLIPKLRDRHEYLLRQDGLWNPSTKKEFNRLYWGKDGIFRSLAPFLLGYFRPGFDPWETDEREDLYRRFQRDMVLIDNAPEVGAQAA